MKKKVLSVLLALSLTVGGAVAAPAENATAAEYKYITMNVPYTDLYEAYDLTDKAVWKVEEGIDAVSTATTNKFLTTDGLAKGTYNDGKYILGATVPVAVSAEDYEGLKADLTVNDNYYFTELAEAPAYYSTLTVTDGKYKFSKIQDSKISTEYLSVDDLILSGKYGDYQITLGGFSTSKGVQVGEDAYEDYTMYGAILNTTDGNSYGMTTLENLWWGAKVPEAEIAWSIIGGKGLQRGHGAGGDFYQFDMNGATLSSVDVITNLGVINISCGAEGLKLDEYYTGDLSALKLSIAADSDVLNISGVPANLENVTISVSGNLATKAAIEDGKVQLKSAPVDGTSYTVTINSSNYTAITKTVSTPIADAQKEELQNRINNAQAVDGYDDDKDLQEHVQEAKDMIADASATSVDAAELISELKEKTKKHYPTVAATATLKGSVLTVELDVALEKLDNPTYTLTYGSGKSAGTLASGTFAALTETLETAPTVGTEYKLTIISDNYQNITAVVTAAEEETVEPTTEEPTSEEVTTKEETTTKAPVVKETTTAAVKLAKVKGVKVKKSGKKKAKITWKKVTKATGYEIQYATNKKFKKAKTVTVKKASTTKKALKKLKSKKTYYVRVRAYTTSAGKKVVGAWSGKKSVKVK